MSVNEVSFDVDRRVAIEQLSRLEPNDRSFYAIGLRLLVLDRNEELALHIESGYKDLFKSDQFDDLEQ